MTKKAKKIDPKHRFAWLDDHGPYEVCMMRYSLVRMRSAFSQLDYNAHFECFATKARVLVDFFTNRRPRKDCIAATDFDPNFKAPARDRVQSIINSIDSDVSHPGTERALVQSAKIQLPDCERLASWIEGALALFLKGLSDAKHWNQAKADCIDRGPIVSIVGGSSPSATNVIITITSKSP
jgi:hypothetical protein